MRRRAILGLVPVCLVGLPWLTPAAGGQNANGRYTVEAARQVTAETDPARLFVTPVIAVHPDDPQTMAIGVGDARHGNCGVRITRDAGLSWATTTSVMPANLPYCVQRNFGTVMGMGFSSEGTLHLGLSGSSLESGHPNGPVSAVAARSDDLGATWQTTVVAEAKPYRQQTGDQVTEGFEQHGLASLAVDPNNPDFVYLGWRSRVVNKETSAPIASIPERSLVASSRDGGRTWGEPVDITRTLDDGQIFGSSTPTPAVGPDGTVYAFIRERPAAPPAGQPRPAQRFFMSRSNDQGRTWTSSMIHPGHIFIYQPMPAIDRDGGIHLIFWQAEGSTLDVPTQIRYMNSTDGGRTWSTPKQLSDDDPDGRFNKYWPGISVAPNGRVDVAWHDFRGDPHYVPQGTGPMGLGSTTQHYSNVYYTYSNDGGTTWSPNVRVTDRSIYRRVGVTFNNQDVVGPVGLASTDRAAHITWSDSRGSLPFDAEDAYFTRVRFDEQVVAGSDENTSKVGWGVAGAGLGLAVGGIAFLIATRTITRSRATASPTVSG